MFVSGGLILEDINKQLLNEVISISCAAYSFKVASDNSQNMYNTTIRAKKE